jgi:hypothetical protein
LCAVSPQCDPQHGLDDGDATLGESFKYNFPLFCFLSVDLSVVYDGYDAEISSLVEVTSNVVQEKLKGDTWVMWAIAQRVNLPLKIEACTEQVLSIPFESYSPFTLLSF